MKIVEVVSAIKIINKYYLFKGIQLDTQLKSVVLNLLLFSIEWRILCTLPYLFKINNNHMKENSQKWQLIKCSAENVA